MKAIILSALMTISLMAAEIDLKKSNFKWTGSKVSENHYGQIFAKSGKLEMNEKGMIKKGEIVMDLKSFTVTDIKGEWATKFLNHMKSADFFDVEKKGFDVATLVVDGDNGKEISGKLSIRGKTNPVKVNYKKSGKSYKGKLTFDRTKFDMKYGSGDFFKNLGDKLIKNEVTVDFNLVLK